VTARALFDAHHRKGAAKKKIKVAASNKNGTIVENAAF